MGGGMGGCMGGPPMKKKLATLKKTGRMGSRFQNQKLVKAINVRWERGWGGGRLTGRAHGFDLATSCSPAHLSCMHECPMQSHVGMEVSCGNLRARLISANLGGMTFEMLDDMGKVRPGESGSRQSKHPLKYSAGCSRTLLNCLQL